METVFWLVVQFSFMGSPAAHMAVPFPTETHCEFALKRGETERADIASIGAECFDNKRYEAFKNVTQTPTPAPEKDPGQPI